MNIETIFEEMKVSPAIESLLKKQANGEEGKLLTDGRANLFFTDKRQTVVYRRIADCREWRVFSTELGKLVWFSGAKVHAPADCM